MLCIRVLNQIKNQNGFCSVKSSYITDADVIVHRPSYFLALTYTINMHHQQGHVKLLLAGAYHFAMQYLVVIYQSQKTTATTQTEGEITPVTQLQAGIIRVV